jgi:carboxyl-terminal processing protease
MLKVLGDRWSTYYGASEYRSFQDALDGHYSGVGLWLATAPTGTVRIGSVLAGSPAARAGLRSGDVLESVASQQVRDIGVTRVAELLRGRADTRVSVVVRRGGSTQNLRLTRATVVSDDVVVEHLRGDISRIQVRAFTSGVGREVRDALAAAGNPGSGGVVLDLRDDPGGLLTEAVEVASVFLDRGPVVSYERAVT